MANYIRSYTRGASYFFTLVTHNRRKIFCNKDFLIAFRISIKQVQANYPFKIIAWVQLPDHLHCIWEIEDKGTNYSQCWSQIKRNTTKLCPQYHLPMDEMSYSQVSRNEKGIFQRRFFEHQIRNNMDFKNHIDYLHYNPVKHGFVNNVKDWQYSTFHRFVKEGIYPLDWGNNPAFELNEFTNSLRLD